MTSPGKQPPSPYGDDVEEAARAFADAVWDNTIDLDPIARFDRREWWRLVHVRAAQLIQAGKGEALSELARVHNHREIEQLLADEGITLSDSSVGQLIRRAQVAQTQ